MTDAGGLHIVFLSIRRQNKHQRADQSSTNTRKQPPNRARADPTGVPSIAQSNGDAERNFLHVMSQHMSVRGGVNWTYLGSWWPAVAKLRPRVLHT